MRGEEIKQLEKQIDKNNNQLLEEKEILDFIQEDKNLKTLGESLNRLPMNAPYLSQKILNWISKTTLFNSKFQNEIKWKVQSKQDLTQKELQLLYLQAQIDPKCLTKPSLLTVSKTPLVSSATKSTDHYWWENLINYLEEKYLNAFTETKQIIHNASKQKSVLYEKQEAPDIRLPGIYLKEGFSNVAIHKLEWRAKENFYDEIIKEKQWALARHRKREKYREDFIHYDLLLFALNKYAEAINKKQESILKISGFKNWEELSQQIVFIQEFNEFLGKQIKEKFPNINQILIFFSQFQKEQQSLEEKYFRSNLEKQKAEDAFRKTVKYEENLKRKYDLKNLQKRLTEEPKSSEEAERFFKDLNSLYAYQQEVEAFPKRIKNAWTKYFTYLQKQQKLIQKYGRDKLKSASETLKQYTAMVSWAKKAHWEIKFNAYEKYRQLISTNRLTQEVASLQNLSKVLLNPLHKDFPIYLNLAGVRNSEIERQARQTATDRWRTDLKKSSPILYGVLNGGAGLWNGLVDSTVGVWSSLGLMMKKLWESDEEWKWSAEFKAKFDDFFKVNLSTAQKESIYDSQKAEININWDNGVNQVASSISQMLTLIYGGGALAKGISMGAAKTGLRIWSNIASKAGLFSMAFTQQVGHSFQEGIQAGMDGKEALAYSFLSSGLQGGLELISPNEILLGKGSSVAKGFIKELCKKGSKQSIQQVGKLFTQAIGKEIFTENIQEAVQLAAGNLANQWANEQWGTNLPSDWHWKNFAATAVITTLTTWIVTGASSITNMPGLLKNQEKELMKRQLFANTELHSEVMQVLEQAIEGKIKLNISKDELVTLRNELEDITKVPNINNKKQESEFWLLEAESAENTEKQINLEKIEYHSQIPIENDKYYRVTWMSEIHSIISKWKLEAPQESFYDRGILTKIVNHSNYTMEELGKLNWNNNTKIQELYKEFVAKPIQAEGKKVLIPRTKSNHGNIAFAKGNLYYDVHEQSSWYYWAPVIVGTNTSKFEAWHHWNYDNKFNDEIESGEPVVLREWLDAKDFEYWFHNEENGRYKLNYEQLKNQINPAQQPQNMEEENREQYQETTDKELELSNEQLPSISDVHKQNEAPVELMIENLNEEWESVDKTTANPELNGELYKPEINQITEKEPQPHLEETQPHLEETKKSSWTQLQELMNQYPELTECINEYKLPLQWVEYFLQTEFGKQVFDNMVDLDNFSNLSRYQKTFELLEINPWNLIEKIQQLWNIPLQENTLNLLIHGHIESLQYLIQNHIIDTKTIHQTYNYQIILADLVSLIKPTDFVNTLDTLWIKTFDDLKTYQYLILDPISTLAEKQNYMKELPPHVFNDRNSYQNLIYKKLHKNSDLTLFDAQHLENIQRSLSRAEWDLLYENKLLDEIITCPPLSLEHKLRLYALLSGDEGNSAYSLKYYSKSQYLDPQTTRKYLTPFEDQIIGSREWSQDLTQQFIRNGKHPPLHNYLIWSISNDLLSKLPVQKWVIYRWVNRNINELSLSLWEIKVGSVIKDPAIPNFTSREKEASWFAHGKTLFVINSKAAKLYQSWVEEHVLYPQNTPMKVVNIEHNINGMENIIYLEEIDAN